MYYVEECNPRGAYNTYLCTSFEEALDLHNSLVQYYGQSRIFQVLNGVEVDLTG